MARKKAHKGHKKLIQGTAVAIIILLLGFFGWKNENIRARLNSSFSDNKSAQKAEYKKQQSIAREKYGTTKSSSQAEKTSVKSSTVVKNSSSSDPDPDKAQKTQSESSASKKKYGSYTVKYGDSLTIIAEKYHTTTTELMDLNKLDTGTINPGAKLIVPSMKGSSTVSSSVTNDNE
ncbi:hypothetical protein JCM15457_2265 [Liquorilactobacillus sucicola DSM 21376 = JCM 15457]|uniref:LysM domain-containing protein n=1 Tax=Liquorilactobacillus sucicola DSM 21376 = JCM 15457 TaxID=1423806 RepID=A0A023D0J7_9LACO|nr:LysM peptidoglycan-binding domain-containing protein [Liquorilactobacillus sucicola]KRN05814.1 hypothetical protein FD15_GL001621 [Liquorilactobacillus sucicola DSM 21376 = JCM 15457]GAJ27290.1 hypothetical protein JCM15457_2265 [Liquorilactobacillus sucicola DSM 21376 = JCM 15457]